MMDWEGPPIFDDGYSGAPWNSAPSISRSSSGLSQCVAYLPCRLRTPRAHIHARSRQFIDLRGHSSFLFSGFPHLPRLFFPSFEFNPNLLSLAISSFPWPSRRSRITLLPCSPSVSDIASNNASVRSVPCSCEIASF